MCAFGRSHRAAATTDATARWVAATLRFPPDAAARAIRRCPLFRDSHEGGGAAVSFVYSELDVGRIVDDHFASMRGAALSAFGAAPVLDATSGRALSGSRDPGGDGGVAFVFDACGGFERSVLSPEAFVRIALVRGASLVRWEDECGMMQCSDCLSRSHVFAFAYPNDVFLYESSRGPRRLVVSYQPADPQLFVGSQSRAGGGGEVAVLLTGETDAEMRGVAPGSWVAMYPMRRRLKRLALESMLSSTGSVTVRPHPGYWQLRCDSVEACKSAGISRGRVVEEKRAYAAAVNAAGVLLVTSSSFRYWLRKYSEGALAGALLLGDMPEGAGHPLVGSIALMHPWLTDGELRLHVDFWRSAFAAPLGRARGVAARRAAEWKLTWTYRVLQVWSAATGCLVV